ncbi:hypothetical protein, variant [Exophiala xenobiotica]|uniref:Uncharacterized protein n=1 Tax=Exophiala xenobiotica TaxID=348802 RepID=A0A0D2ENG8_9EURO|nr:hypothetical protein, variant [Exophiala xenobiotica]KIW49389.1 hypothetical protein, variant [Exophiala xenobiotica]
MTRIPATLADANDGDRMMWAWKLKGKSWSAIQDEYLKLTGKNYGHSTLSVRFHMMKRTFASNGALEYVRDCEVMMKADKEIEKQRFEAAARIYKAEGETHTPAAIKKRWADMRDLGRDVHPEERYRPEDKELPNQGGLALDFAETEWGAPKTTERMITEEDLAKAKAMVQRATLVSYPDSD